MGSLITEILAVQMAVSGAKPLTCAPGRNSMEQLENRAAQEAALNGSNFIELNHFLGALFGHPNGGVRFYLNDAMRELGVREADIRQKLGLCDYDPDIPVPEIEKSPEVGNIYLLSGLYAKQRGEDMTLVDLLASTASNFCKVPLNRAEDPQVIARVLVNHIINNY